MSARPRQSRSVLAPLAENLTRRFSNADARWRRKVLRIGILIIGAYFVLNLLVGSYSMPRIIRLELERKTLVAANRQLTADLIDKDRLRKMLRSDPLYIEFIARTRYHMVRPNEAIYYYRGR